MRLGTWCTVIFLCSVPRAQKAISTLPLSIPIKKKAGHKVSEMIDHQRERTLNSGETRHKQRNEVHPKNREQIREVQALNTRLWILLS